MPVEDSRLSGFYKLSVEERRDIVAKLALLSKEDVEALATYGELSEVSADRMIENAVSYTHLRAHET